MTDLPPDAPYCAECGYDLSGATDSARCPECGRPLVDVLRRRQERVHYAGRRWTSKRTIFGMPVVDVAYGPREGEPRGKARGFIAIGDDALGVLALGGVARGVVALGGVAIGGFTAGGLSIGALAAAGGMAVSTGMSVGGGSIGTFATGGGAAGLVAQGGAALGYYARGGGAFGAHTLGANPGQRSGEAAAFFDSIDWLMGAAAAPSQIAGALAYTAALVVGSIVVAGGLLLLVAFVGARDTEQR